MSYNKGEKMKKVFLSLMLFVFIVPQSVWAEDLGLYVSGTLGMSADSTTEIDRDFSIDDPRDEFNTSIFDLSDIEFGSDNNVTGFIALGKKIGKSFRMELEYGFRSSNINRLKANTSSYSRRNAENEANWYKTAEEWDESEPPWVKKYFIEAVNEANEMAKNDPAIDKINEQHMDDFMGDLDIHSLMANFYVDLNEGSKFRPYVGAGVGFAWANYEIYSQERLDITWSSYKGENDGYHPITKNDQTVKLEGDYFLDRTATAFGYQFMAGLGYEVAPKIVLTGGYRLFGTTGQFDTVIHAAEAGIRYSF